jgi:histidine triad (HIT) family protein
LEGFMTDCVFCKIAAGEIPAHKVYEDDTVVAFLDVAHFTKGHTLIIPKSHYVDLLDTPDEVVAKIAVLAKDLATNYKPTLAVDGFNIKQNSGHVAGQEVMHYHVHLIPRYNNGSFRFDIVNKEEDVDLAEVAAKLRND